MSLLRGIARTAVISGTASAVNGRVARRQAARFAEEDARTAALRQQAYQAHAGQQAPSRAAVPPPQAGGHDQTDAVLAQLKVLGDLRAQGILTEAEFAAQKRKILAQ